MAVEVLPGATRTFSRPRVIPQVALAAHWLILLGPVGVSLLAAIRTPYSGIDTLEVLEPVGVRIRRQIDGWASCTGRECVWPVNDPDVPRLLPKDGRRF